MPQPATALWCGPLHTRWLQVAGVACEITANHQRLHTGYLADDLPVQGREGEAHVD